MFKQDHTVVYLHSNVPEFIEPENWQANSPDLNSRRLFSVDSVVADGVTSQNFRHWSAEASSDRLLGSPGNTEVHWTEQLISCQKSEDGYQGKGWSCWILSGLTICVKRSSLFHCILNENWTKLMRHCQIQCNFGGIDDLCKLGKEYLTALKCNLCISL